MSFNPPRRIALVVCSSRPERVALTVHKWVHKTLAPLVNTSISLETVDLREWNLPFLDEPHPAKQVPAKASYVNEHTKQWSAAIASYDGFLFLTPQYNGGYPASAKNAIDYLYAEWTRKPAMVVSYGIHGGGFANKQLSEVLGHMKMKLVSVLPQLRLLRLGAGHDNENEAPDEQAKVWESEQGEALRSGWRELVRLLDS